MVNAKYLRIRLWLILICLAIYSQGTSQNYITSSTDTLKVLSWNIFMLPKLIKFTGKKRRAAAIGHQLRQLDYDIVVFQEAFHSTARRKILETLGNYYPYQLGPANQKRGLKTHSGIWILSKMPLESLGEIQFSSCQGIDCFARKGALLAQGIFKGRHFQVLGTHLESEGPIGINYDQCREIRELLQAHQKPGIPQILCGDFNVSKDSIAYYQKILQILQAEDGDLIGTQQYTFDGQKCDLRRDKNRGCIDYIFYRTDKPEEVEIQRRVRILREAWHKRKKDLSDHFAVEAFFIYR